VNKVIVLLQFMLSITFVMNVSLHLQYACRVCTGCKEVLCAFRKFSLFSRMSRVRYTVGSQEVSLVSFLLYSMSAATVCYSASFLKGESAVICLKWFFSVVKGETGSSERSVFSYGNFGTDGKPFFNLCHTTFWSRQEMSTALEWRV